MGGGAASQASGKTLEQAHQPSHNGWSSPSEDEVQWLRRALEQEKQEKQWLMTRFEQQAFYETRSSGSKQSANGTPDPMVIRRMQEELGLLRKALDAEKVEKEWIMKRFERVEADLQTRTQECAHLRSQLLKTPPVAVASGPTAVAPGHLPSLTPTGAQENHEPPQLPGQPPSPVVQEQSPGHSPASASGKVSPGNLKARRGLNLSVSTGKKEKPSSDAVTRLPSKDKSPTLETATTEDKPKQEVRELAPSKRQEFLQRLSESGPIASEPMTACAFGSKRSTWAAGNCEEPMSPLLRRRRGTQDMAPPKQNMTSLIMSQQSGGLAIATPKLEKLDDDVPCSPKVRKPRRKSSDRFSDCESIKE